MENNFRMNFMARLKQWAACPFARRGFLIMKNF
jgi:hypothetical protein